MGAVYLPSQFGVMFLPLANVQVKPGDKLRITCQYSHIGQTDSQPLYAAIGNEGWAGFNEVLHGSKTINVPENATWNYHEEYIDITITTAISAGFYDLYTKIGGTFPKVISPTLLDVVEVMAETPESEFGEISITDYAKV